MGLSSCKKIKAPNVEICGRLQLGAQCTHTAKGPKRRLSEAEWLEINIGRISFDPEGWASVRTYIEESCAKHKDCIVDEVAERLDAFEAKVYYGLP